jgi:hypothetical protein
MVDMPTKHERVMQSLAYLLIGISTIPSFHDPLPSFTQTDSPVWTVFIWAGFLTVGGAVGAWAAIRRSVVWELLAIVVLVTGFIAYGALQIYRLAHDDGRGVVSFAGTWYPLAIAAALSMILLRRAHPLWKLVKMAPHGEGR